MGGGAEEKLTPEEEKVQRCIRFPKWVDYEDEFVKLRYPKDPLITLEVAKAGEGVRVEGGVCTTVDNRCQQSYMLKIGKATYGLFLLQPAEWLDDGICFCGPMVHEVYQVRDGCLVRYSLLPGGAVKKAQILGNHLRLMAFEWTHLACQRPVYEEMVESMRLKLPNPKSEQEWRAETARRYGWGGEVGWAHAGDSKEQMIALLGAPAEDKDDLTTWMHPWGDYMSKVEARFQSGRFAGFTGWGMKHVTEVPITGTLSWVSGYTRDPGRGQPEKERPSNEELAKTLKDLEPSITGDRWNDWCYALAGLEEKGLRDSDLLQAVVRRARGGRSDLEALDRGEYPLLKTWVADWLRKSVPPAGIENPETNQNSVAVSALLAWQADHDPEAFKISVGFLLDARNVDLTQAVLDQSEHLNPADRTRAVAQIIRLAREEHGMGLIYSLLNNFETLKFDHPEEVREQLLLLQKEDQNGDWKKEISKALKTLE